MHSFDSFCWQLLDHCVRGKNGWSGKNGSRIDFIATHRCFSIKFNLFLISVFKFSSKGTTYLDKAKTQRVARTRTILDAEKIIYQNISQKFPELARTKFINDEGDPIVTWSKEEKKNGKIFIEKRFFEKSRVKKTEKTKIPGSSVDQATDF